ncbi:GerAB/ArcD/ProY family transporter [Peribacillus frigoritolerans]|uniref:GerAB/ArcD/ProY family transporter n=1 Tax=Peribacillus frigoritolerans TaxID=450367 RepID=UPI0039A28EA5
MKKISSIQTLSIFFLSIGLLNHVILIPFLLSTGGRDAWFFSILTIGLIPIWAYILSRIIKNMNNQSLTDGFENRFGKHIKNIALFFIVIYLISLVLATTKETIDWITTSFLFETPSLAIIIPFTLLNHWSNEDSRIRFGIYSTQYYWIMLNSRVNRLNSRVFVPFSRVNHPISRVFAPNSRVNRLNSRVNADIS